MLNKRVYGVLGIKSIMSNWNAGFDGYPRTTSKGDVFGSDKALKYPMKKYWESKGKKVLSIKTLKSDSKKGIVSIRPKSLKERYEEIYDIEDLKSLKDDGEFISSLFDATDVKNFGVTFAEESKNIGITGAVQINQGFNKYEDSEALEFIILTPFKDPKAKEKNKDGEDAKSSSLGTKIISDEAHYFYSFSINPYNYAQYVEQGLTDGYTEKDYNEFKEAALISATALNTNSKFGCENEFGLFVETNDELYLPDLSQYIEFEKMQGDKDMVILKLDQLLNSVKKDVLSVEVYYNPYKLAIKGDIQGAKYFDIFTKKEL